MSLTTAVLKHLAELEAQVHDLYGWDSGVCLWNLHAHEEDYSDLSPMKMGGSEAFEGHPLDLVQRLTPPPPCTVGLVITWEAWHSPNGVEPACDDPERIDVRYAVAALHNGAVMLLEHKRDQKPRINLMDSMRLLTAEPNAGAVCAGLHDVMTSQPDTHPILGLLQRLMGEGGGGFIVMGGPDA